jgi:uncharacterized protein (TIGR02246 family)
MTRLASFALASVLVAATGADAAAQSVDLAKKDVGEVVAKWEAAVNNRSTPEAAAHDIAMLFAEDGVLNVADGAHVGQSAIETFYVAAIKNGNPTDIRITVSDVRTAGDAAWAYGTTSQKSNGKPIDFYWGAVYSMLDGHYRLKMLTGALKPPPPAATTLTK